MERELRRTDLKDIYRLKIQEWEEQEKGFKDLLASRRSNYNPNGVTYPIMDDVILSERARINRESLSSPKLQGEWVSDLYLKYIRGNIAHYKNLYKESL